MAAHPLEHLRFVARGWAVGDDLPSGDVAALLAQLAQESPNMLLQACRRIIEYFPSSGVAWWLSARALSAADPVEGIWEAADELEEDPTPALLAAALPPDVGVALAQPSAEVALAVRRRRDLRTEKRAAAADLVVVSAVAAGPAGVMVSARGASIAASATTAGKPVWAVVARGVLLPGELWEHLVALALPGPGGEGGGGEGLHAEVLAGSTLDVVVGDRGSQVGPAALSHPTCPAVAELRGWRI
jgi:hypothetical protein